MRRKMVLAIAAVAMVGAGLGLATRAMAYPGVSFGTPCNVCHSGAGVNPVATLVSNDGVNATYNVSNPGLEWALFSGATRLAGQPGATGQFTVAVGGSYTLFSVQGFPGPLGVATVAPTSPVATFTVMASAGPNGSISPGSMTANSGSSLTYTITANTGYHVADVLVDGVSVGAVTTFTFTNVTANHTISVSFAADVLASFTITPTAGPNGSISPAMPQTAVSGSSMSFMIAASTGFHVADVLVDGASVGAVGSYTFNNIAADHTISVTFEANPAGMFTITPQAGAHGSISPTSVQTIAAGASATFVFTPDTGYHIEAVAVDGVQIPTVSSYTFTNVQANHTIAVSFSADPEKPRTTALALSANVSSIRRNGFVRFTSRLSDGPGAMFFGCRVIFQVKKPGSTRWVTLTTRVATPSTGVAGTGRVQLTRRGNWYFRAIFRGTDDFKGSVSRTVRVTVR